jgi:hypothetical protein
MAFASLFPHRSCRTGAVASLLLLAAAGGCVQEQDYLNIEKAVWFQSVDDCLLDASADPPAAMTADVALGDRIGLGFVVTNNQTPNANSNSGIDDSEVEIESVEVNLSFSGGAISGGSFEAKVPNNTLAGGDSAPFLVQVPTEVVDSMRASMTAGQYETLDMEVVFVGRKYGTSYGGKLGEVSTRAFTYPIEICYGCLPCGGCGFPQYIEECPEPDAGDTGTTGP